jgi:integrase/recombinase XerC
MNALTVTRHPRMMRDEDLVRDPRWQRTPIGRQCRRWLDTLRWDDASPNTISSYTVLAARLALEFDHLDGLHEFSDEHRDERGGGTAELRWFLDRYWRDSSAATRSARRSALRSLFAWAEEEGLCPSNPTLRIKAPKTRRVRRQAHGQDVVVQLVYGQQNPRDRIALELLARRGLRKNELRLIQYRDFRLDTAELMVKAAGAKGRKARIVPLGTIARDLDWYLLLEQPRPTDYLLGATREPWRPRDPSNVHRWFKDRLTEAGLPDMPMHELRHTAADHVYRVTKNLAAVQLMLGHDNIGTTQTYLHPSTEDLARALAVVDEKWLEQTGTEGVR